MTMRRGRPLLRAGMVGDTAYQVGTKAEQGHQGEYERAAAVAAAVARARLRRLPPVASRRRNSSGRRR